MKNIKLLPLLLILTLIITGCGSTKTTEPPVVNTAKPITLGESGTETSNSNDTNVTNSIDIIHSDLINNLGYYDSSYGYTDKPADKYIYPEYIDVDGKLKTVYLNIEGVKESQSSYYSYNSYNSYAPSIPLSVAAEADYSSGSGVESIGTGIYNGIKGMFSADEPLNTSEFNSVNESGYLSTKLNPLSTFSADVDTASYTNIRGILREYAANLNNEECEFSEVFDEMHDARIEEMLNYFNFSESAYSENIFSIRAEIGSTPWNSETKLLVINIKANNLPKEQETGSNLVFLMDTSGSMDDYNKLELAKQSMLMLLDNLTEKDTVSIVTYSGSAGTIISGANAARDKEKIQKAINDLVAYGSTNGEGGIKEAYRIAEEYQNNHSNSRIIMCSDGDLNVGISSVSELEKLITKERESGVYLTILGFGQGNYKDNKMETLADMGNGNYYFIDSLKEGYKVLVEDITSTLVTVADDVKFQIEFNPSYIKAYRKIGYENRDLAAEDFANDAVDGGEVGYGQEVTIVYEIVTGDSNMELPEIGLKYQTTEINTDTTDWATLSIRYKNHGESTSNLLESIIDESSYTNDNSREWRFIADVVGFGLLINESEYTNGLTIDDIINSLKKINYDDPDKVEFASLVNIYKLMIEHGD